MWAHWQTMAVRAEGCLDRSERINWQAAFESTYAHNQTTETELAALRAKCARMEGACRSALGSSAPRRIYEHLIAALAEAPKIEGGEADDNGTPETCYSINEEDFDYTCIEDAADYVWNNWDVEIGSVATVFEGDSAPTRAPNFVPSMSDLMEERAYEEHGEYSESWEFDKEDGESLQEAVEAVVDKWAKEHHMQPRFYGVENVRPIQIRFIDDEGKYEIVNEKDSK